MKDGGTDVEFVVPQREDPRITRDDGAVIGNDEPFQRERGADVAAHGRAARLVALDHAELLQKGDVGAGGDHGNAGAISPARFGQNTGDKAVMRCRNILHLPPTEARTQRDRLLRDQQIQVATFQRQVTPGDVALDE